MVHLMKCTKCGVFGELEEYMDEFECPQCGGIMLPEGEPPQEEDAPTIAISREQISEYKQVKVAKAVDVGFGGILGGKAGKPVGAMAMPAHASQPSQAPASPAMAKPSAPPQATSNAAGKKFVLPGAKKKVVFGGAAKKPSVPAALAPAAPAPVAPQAEPPRPLQAELSPRSSQPQMAKPAMAVPASAHRGQQSMANAARQMQQDAAAQFQQPMNRTSPLQGKLIRAGAPTAHETPPPARPMVAKLASSDAAQTMPEIPISGFHPSASHVSQLNELARAASSHADENARKAREMEEIDRLRREREDLDRLRMREAEEMSLRREREELERQRMELEDMERKRRQAEEMERLRKERDELERQKREFEEAERLRKERDELERQKRELEELERKRREEAEKAKLKAEQEALERQKRELAELERKRREEAEKTKLKAEQEALAKKKRELEEQALKPASGGKKEEDSKTSPSDEKKPEDKKEEDVKPVSEEKKEEDSKTSPSDEKKPEDKKEDGEKKAAKGKKGGKGFGLPPPKGKIPGAPVSGAVSSVSRSSIAPSSPLAPKSEEQRKLEEAMEAKKKKIMLIIGGGLAVVVIAIFGLAFLVRNIMYGSSAPAPSKPAAAASAPKGAPKEVPMVSVKFNGGDDSKPSTKASAPAKEETQVAESKPALSQKEEDRRNEMGIEFIELGRKLKGMEAKKDASAMEIIKGLERQKATLNEFLEKYKDFSSEKPYKGAQIKMKAIEGSLELYK